MLDNGADRLVELLRQIPRGLQVDNVVVGKLFALQLARIGNALPARGVGVHRGLLVRILSVAQVHHFLKDKRRFCGKPSAACNSKSPPTRSSVEAMAES